VTTLPAAPTWVYDGPDLWSWEWWTQGALPILIGVVSILVSVLALVFAIAANNQARASNTTAQAALDLSREVSEREAREREEDRERVLREKRARIVREITEAYSERFTKRHLTADDNSYGRMLQVATKVRAACRREGLTDLEDKPIIGWLLRRQEEVEVGIERESGSGDPIAKRSYTLRGWRVLGGALRRELEIWQQTGQFNTDRTVHEMMPHVHFPKEDREDLNKMSKEIGAEEAARRAAAPHDIGRA